MNVKVAQSRPAFCDRMNHTVHEILQTRILEWVTVPFSGNLPNPGLPHCRRILYQLSHQGSPRILEWVVLSLLQWIFLTQASRLGRSCLSAVFVCSSAKSLPAINAGEGVQKREPPHTVGGMQTSKETRVPQCSSQHCL